MLLADGEKTAITTPLTVKPAQAQTAPTNEVVTIEVRHEVAPDRAVIIQRIPSKPLLIECSPS